MLKSAVWKEAVREALFPLGCALCGKVLYKKPSVLSGRIKKHPDSFYGLCSACREKLLIPNMDMERCSLCGQPLISEKKTCLPCRNGPERSFDRIISLYPYMGKYQKAFASYKFGKRLSLGNFFAEKLWQGLDLLSLSINSAELGLIPVPARPGKIKKNGWDQIEYLAKLLEYGSPLKPELSIPVIRCLKRLPSETQKELNRENRLQNLKGRIIVRKTRNILSKQNVLLTVPKTAVVFDDVYTTGSTMDACAAALKAEGAENVYGICLCYD